MSSGAVVLALHACRSEIWDSQYAGLRRYCLPRRWDVVDYCFPGAPDFARIRRLLKEENVIGIVTSLPVPLPKDILSKQPVVCSDFGSLRLDSFAERVLMESAIPAAELIGLDR